MRNTATESDGIPIIGKARSRRDFLKLSGAGLAVVASTGAASVASRRPAGRKAFEEGAPAPELRLRGGDEPLSAATSTNAVLFSLRFGPSFTLVPRSSFGDELRCWIEDGEGNIVADKRLPRSDAIRVSFEPGELAESGGSALRVYGRMQEGDSFGNNSGLQFGILRERAALPAGERSNSPFGIISTQRLTLDGRSMHRCGIRWQHHHGLRSKNWTNRNGSPPDRRTGLRIPLFTTRKASRSRRTSRRWSRTPSAGTPSTWAKSSPSSPGRLPELSGTWTRPAGRERPRRGKVTIEVGFKPYLVISPIGTRLTF
jgi:hypothetical protein